MTDAGLEVATDSVVIAFRYTEAGGPVGVVIGPSHAPYYLFSCGRREPTTPGLEPPQTSPVGPPP